MNKKSMIKKSLYAMCILTLSIISAFCVYAASISFYNMNVSQVTRTSARVAAKINNPSKLYMTTAGVYFGPAGNLRRIEEAVNNRTITDMWYDTAKWYGELQPGTEYYYQFFVVANGVEYKSDMRTFTTEADPSFYNMNVSQVTKTSARVAAKINNPSKLFVTTAGVYLGPAGNPKRIEEAVNNNTVTDMWYDTTKWYGELQPGTEYHYQFFIVANGVEYKSPEQTFTTEAAPVAAAGVSGITQLPLPTNNTPVFPEGFYLHQTSNVSCTFFATINMVRSKAFLEGRNYTSINEASAEGYAWVNGIGLAARPITIPLFDAAGRRDYIVEQGDYWSFGNTNYVKIQDMPVEQKREMLKIMLTEHPEGIVIWDAVGHRSTSGRVTTHAALLTNYDANTGIFYVADSGSVNSFTVPNGPEGNVAYTKKTELKNLCFFGGAGEDEKIRSITRVLFVK